MFTLRKEFLAVWRGDLKREVVVNHDRKSGHIERKIKLFKVVAWRLAMI